MLSRVKAQYVANQNKSWLNLLRSDWRFQIVLPKSTSVCFLWKIVSFEGILYSQNHIINCLPTSKPKLLQGLTLGSKFIEYRIVFRSFTMVHQRTAPRFKITWKSWTLARVLRLGRSSASNADWIVLCGTDMSLRWSPFAWLLRAVQTLALQNAPIFGRWISMKIHRTWNSHGCSSSIIINIHRILSEYNIHGWWNIVHNY